MNGITTKFIAALAVFAMVFAGVGAMAVAENNDAADDAKTLTLFFEGVYLDDSDKVLTFIQTGNGVIYYVATLDDDFEEKITILNKEYYDTLKDNKLIKGMTVTVPLVAETPEIDIANEDILEGLKIFCSVDVSKTGEIKSGLSTKIVWPAAELGKNIVYDVVFEEDAEAAVAAAVAIVEAFYADYSSPEEVAQAIDKAVEDFKVSEEFKDIIEKAKQAAVEQYIIDHPVVEKENKTFFYGFVVALVIAIALAVALTYFYVIPKMRAKKAVEEPPKA